VKELYSKVAVELPDDIPASMRKTPTEVHFQFKGHNGLQITLNFVESSNECHLLKFSICIGACLNEIVCAHFLVVDSLAC